MRTFFVTVTDPTGPRAAVTRPAFDCAVPILSAVPTNTPEPAVRIRLDCSGHPGAAEFLAAREHDVLHVSVQMWTHSTGNGYVVLHIDSSEDATEAGPAGQIEVVLDPVVHAQVIKDLAAVGRVLLADQADEGGGWLISIDATSLEQANTAALTHPRRVAMRMGPPDRVA